MNIVEGLEQNSPEWLSWRKNKLGASDCPIIMGESPWCTPMQLFDRKMGFAPEQEETQAMADGKSLEPIARQAFETYMRCRFPATVGQHDEYDFMIASFDGLNENAALEIKIPGEKDHHEASQGRVPEKYRYQLQHQLAVSGLDMLYYYSFDKSRYKIDKVTRGHIVEVHRDQQMIDWLIEACKTFYKCMITCTPPELSDRDYNIRDDRRWEIVTLKWKMAKDDLDLAKTMEESVRRELIGISESQNSKGFGVKVQKIMRKGSVKYSEIPELKEIDLDAYRLSPTESWRITLDD